MKNRIFACLMVSILAGSLMTTAAADEVTLPAAKDNTLAENVVDNNNGAGFSLYSGSTSFNGLRRALLAFDVSSIPAGSKITSVSLELREINGLIRNGEQDFSLHRITADWGEGTSDGTGNGSLATAGASTWNANFFGSSTWDVAGGDFVPTPSATQNFNSTNVMVASTSGLVADVQDWLDNGSNFGWALLGNEQTTETAWRFASSESTFGQPMLTVTFVPIPEPASAILLVAALGCGLWELRKKTL